MVGSWYKRTGIRMNKRIRQLAEQAKQYALDAMIKITDKEQALKVYSETYDTKFAELIVKECVGILEPKSRYMGEGPEVLKDKIRQIKQHFGVEE
jgi:phage gp46-like protein